jgi:8-oxo-dGTP pyrophosphatase MutT (NUDIX family)
VTAAVDKKAGVRERIRAQVEQIEPHDALEAEHRADTLTWLAGTADVFRRRSPDVPNQHLVSYFVVADETEGRNDPAFLLVDHRKAGLWLPPGGHVEVGEDPWSTVRREAAEELFLTAAPTKRWGTEPAFVTVTPTRGPRSHLDVSLWFVISAKPDDVLSYDQSEFSGIRWFTSPEILDADPETLDPHLQRFITKFTHNPP